MLVNKLSYKLHPVHRGDIVVFKAPPDADPAIKDLVKRVIGLPGRNRRRRTTATCTSTARLLEGAVPPEGHDHRPSFATLKVPPDSYWVMGDNR